MKANLLLQRMSKNLLIVLLICCISFVACINHTKSGTLSYVINEDEKSCTIIGIGTYFSNDLLIPSTIDGYKVTAIADYAFQGLDIESFSGGDCIISLGAYAFQNCKQLRMVKIPDSVKVIGEFCFEHCEQLSNVILPANLEVIEHAAFAYCSNINSITLPNGTITIGDFAFSLCQKMVSVNIPNTVKTIGNSAFAGCQQLENIEIPNSVTYVGNSAFALCLSLEKFYFPETCTTIGAAPLWYTNLSSIDVASNHPTLQSIDGNLYFNNTVLVNYAPGKTDTTFKIPNGIAEIGRESFAGCLNLKIIYIPKSVSYIGHVIFYASPNIDTIYYDGSIEDWLDIEKESDWDKKTDCVFTIVCTNGSIAMDGTVTYK